MTGAPDGAAPTPQDGELLPEGWRPSLETIELNRKRGRTDADLEREVESMADWAKHTGARSYDWDSFFRLRFLGRGAKSEPPADQRERPADEDPRWDAIVPSPLEFAKKVMNQLGAKGDRTLERELTDMALRRAGTFSFAGKTYTCADGLAFFEARGNTTTELPAATLGKATGTG